MADKRRDLIRFSAFSPDKLNAESVQCLRCKHLISRLLFKFNFNLFKGSQRDVVYLG